MQLAPVPLLGRAKPWALRPPRPTVRRKSAGPVHIRHLFPREILVGPFYRGLNYSFWFAGKQLRRQMRQGVFEYTRIFGQTSKYGRPVKAPNAGTSKNC
jgi:hypothetical protein